MKLPQAVLFDMDNTLIESEKLFAAAVEEFIEWRCRGAPIPPPHEMVGVSNEAIVSSLLERTAGFADSGAVRDGCRWITRRVEESFRGELATRPGALRLLQMLQDAGIPLALVTTTERRLVELALDRIGRDFFDVTICGDEVGQQKPSPEPYERAARALGLGPGDCVAVEDSPSGAESALRAGCRVLVVPNGVPVPIGRRQVVRASLMEVDLEVLASVAALP